jgi:hypothetical protein
VQVLEPMQAAIVFIQLYEHHPQGKTDPLAPLLFCELVAKQRGVAGALALDASEAVAMATGFASQAGGASNGSGDARGAGVAAAGRVGSGAHGTSGTHAPPASA